MDKTLDSTDIDWIDRGADRTPADAIACLSSVVDNADGVLLVVRRLDGTHMVRAFGELEVVDLALIASMLSYQAARAVYGPDDENAEG